MDRPLHPDDIVAKKANESHVGVVERTHADFETHEPLPQRSEDKRVLHDEDVSQAAFRKFLRDGVPPRNTVLVRWQHTPHTWLMPCGKLKLLDRSLRNGDLVKKHVRDAMSGVVINTHTRCTLQPMCDITYQGKHVFKGLLRPGPLEPGFERPAGDSAPPLVRDVPASELKESESLIEGDLVIYKDWIGRVASVISKILIKLTDNCVVEVAFNNGDGTLRVGDVALGTKGKWRNVRWIFGQYNPNTPPVGTVVEVRPVEVEVAWLQRSIWSTSDIEPPATLEGEELGLPSFQVYDRTRRPRPPASGSGACASSTVSNSEIFVRLGLPVRFKDLAGACVKYDGSDAHGKVPRHDRSSTLGYDLNVFDVVGFQTDVTIQWQDLTITKEASIDLVPDSSIDDEHAAWPGEIAHTLDVSPVPNMPTVEQPSKVGVIQSVSSEERMANIRWAPNAVIQYSADAAKETGLWPVLVGAVGFANGPVEEISLYDVEVPAPLNARRGDIVLIVKKMWTERRDAPSTSGADWLGEIVDTCLDGTLTVRLGAANEVRDVQLCREDVVVALRSDGTDDLDDWDDGEDGGDSIDEVMLEHPEMFMDGSDNMGIRHDELDTDEAEAQAKYEDENGQPLDEDEVENEDWESDDEDKDVEMTDAAPVQTPPTSTSATPPENSKRRDETSLGTNEPPQYLILDTTIPPSHHYSTQPSSSNPGHVKRVQKEHRIFQKPEAIPKGVYIRTWEGRLDLLRALFIGPSDTSYSDCPFVVDFYLPPEFPTEPPQAFFHSWSGESGLGGVGRVNPNLYEDGKVCLSLLGTWEGSKGEGWSASRSTLLQVIVSLLGLVLVREPYFNEPGYEHLAGMESSKRPSALYNERAFLRSRTFLITALSRLRQASDSEPAQSLEGLEEALVWGYWSEGGPRLIDKVVRDVETVLERSEEGDAESDGLTVMSRGACIPLRRVLERLRQLQKSFPRREWWQVPT